MAKNASPKRHLFIAKNLIMMLVLAVAALAGCGNDTAKKDAAQKIVVGLDDNFPPMGFKDEKNEIVGFDIDLG